MNSIVRLAAAVNQVKVASPVGCFVNIRDQLASLIDRPADIVVFPRYCLSSPSCGGLFQNNLLLESAREQLENLCIVTRSQPGYCIVGLPVSRGGKTMDVTAVLCRGELLGMLANGDAAQKFPSEEGTLLPPDTVFASGNLRFSILACNPSQLPLEIGRVAQNGCDLILVPSYEPAVVGKIDQVEETLRVLSRSLGCAIAVVNGGVGDTSSPHCYRGYAMVYECGKKLGRMETAYQPDMLQCDLDCTVIQKLRHYHASRRPDFTSGVWNGERGGLLRPVAKNPYFSEDGEQADRYLEELFDLQVASLVARLQNTGIDRVVIGVSGGLDSTLALLVAARAFDVLSISRQNILGVTMPGFGTTDRTYFNALSLLEALEAQSRDISIKAAVSQHFEDIGHNPAQRNTTYENAQARERAQILLDLANQVGGLVVGTGDLTEQALGWCTFAGDQIANYNVNTCLTKNMVRQVVELVSRKNLLERVGEVLPDILDTPVSPELLPPDEDGEMVQKSEEILGPYELHDFFLYYFVHYGMSPSRVLDYACVAFGEEYSTDYLREKLRLFLRRFVTGQFKRSCAPDSASITPVNLSSSNYTMASDLSPAMYLADLDVASLF